MRWSNSTRGTRERSPWQRVYASVVVAALAAASHAGPAAGSAACQYVGGTAEVTITGSDPVSLSVGEAGEILVSGGACSEATVDNTERVVFQGGNGDQRVVLDESERALATAASERIVVALTLEGGKDVLVLHRSSADDRIVIGKRGVTVTSGAIEPEITLGGATEVVKINAGDGADVVSAGGSTIAGRPFGGRTVVKGEKGDDALAGGAAGDALTGGSGTDEISGEAGSDALDGDPGNDRLHGGPGNDRLRGGGGTDTCFQYGGRGMRRSCELPASGSPLPTSPPGRLLIVNQNVKEVHAKSRDHVFPRLRDLQSHKEFANFAKRLPRWVPYAPDVLVLQEVDGRGARRVAKTLERVLKQPYRAVVRPRVRALRTVQTSAGVTWIKTNTAVIINQKTTKFLRGGFFETSMLERDRTAGIISVQRQAHALVRERGSSLRAAVMAIHFNSNKRFATKRLGFRRRAAWSEKSARYMRRHYPSPDIRVLAGEFATRRCVDIRRERVTCDESRLWKLLTRDFHYVDAVYAANSTSNADIREQQKSNHGRAHRIDYVFVQGHVVTASRDVRYSARYGDRDFISDHKGDFALIGLGLAPSLRNAGLSQ